MLRDSPPSVPIRLLLVLTVCSQVNGMGQNLGNPDVTYKLSATAQSVLNSGATESDLFLSSDGLLLIFTTDRGGNFHNNKYTSGFDSDLYFSTRRTHESAWNKPQAFGALINNGVDQDEGCLQTDSTGDTFLTFQSWGDNWESEGGPYYMYEILDSAMNVRNAPTPLDPVGRSFTQFIAENEIQETGGMVRTKRGSVIFSAAKEKDGPMNIYYARKVEDAGFAPIELLSCSNAQSRETSVTLSQDERVLYFASDRVEVGESRGGLDLYAVDIQEEEFSLTLSKEVVHLGDEINTEGDESSLVQVSEQQYFFIRNGDVYRADIKRLKK